MPLVVSLSAFQSWQRCEQSYDYGYVRRLRPLFRDVAPQRGIILHEYLAAFYQALKDGAEAAVAQRLGLKRLEAYTPTLKQAVQVAFLAGDEAQALIYQNMPQALLAIAQRYYDTRGRTDATDFDVLMVEQMIDVELVPGITSRSIVDLVLRERDGRGLTWLVEHKSTGSVPDSQVRIRDLQTLLYATKVEKLGTPIDGILWNYIRTKDPDTPHKNKNGKFSRAVSVDTTWPIYEQALVADGQDPEEYADVRDRLWDRETTVFFPRFEHVIVAKPQVLLDDYVRTATRMRQARWEWERGVSRPVRTLSRDCSYCSFYRLCEAAITGGDEEDLIRMKFTTAREEKV